MIDSGHYCLLQCERGKAYFHCRTEAPIHPTNMRKEKSGNPSLEKRGPQLLLDVEYRHFLDPG
jgi:hypothetical protein